MGRAGVLWRVSRDAGDAFAASFRIRDNIHEVTSILAGAGRTHKDPMRKKLVFESNRGMRL